MEKTMKIIKAIKHIWKLSPWNVKIMWVLMGLWVVYLCIPIELTDKQHVIFAVSYISTLILLSLLTMIESRRRDKEFIKRHEEHIKGLQEIQNLLKQHDN